MRMRRIFLGCLCAGCAVLVGAIMGEGDARGDTWRERKEDVEWAFKLGAVSVALEKCPFQKGARFGELETNAREVVAVQGKRSQDEGRRTMMILDGPDLSALCGTAYKFFGPAGRDLSGVLALRPSSGSN